MIPLPFTELYETGFKDKEIRKALSFASIIAPRFNRHFNSERIGIIDLCAGNGLGSFIFQFCRLAKESIMIDIEQPKRFSKLHKLFKKYELYFNYIQDDIRSNDFELKNLYDFNKNAIISIHPCSELGDRVIDIGLKNNLPFALMTCCHKSEGQKYILRNPPDPRLMLYKDPADYFDLVRRRYVEENGWQCFLEEVPERITPKNHVLIGIPPRI